MIFLIKSKRIIKKVEGDVKKSKTLTQLFVFDPFTECKHILFESSSVIKSIIILYTV